MQKRNQLRNELHLKTFDITRSRKSNHLLFASICILTASTDIKLAKMVWGHEQSSYWNLGARCACVPAKHLTSSGCEHITENRMIVTDNWMNGKNSETACTSSGLEDVNILILEN